VTWRTDETQPGSSGTVSRVAGVLKRGDAG
jgi:hypothetical protein